MINNLLIIALIFFKEKCGNFSLMIKALDLLLVNNRHGGMKSELNDKAGDINMLYRLFNQQNIKLTFKILN